MKSMSNSDKHSTRIKELYEYLEKLTMDDIRVIIKYGLRNTDAPKEVTVDDIINCIIARNVDA